MDCLFSVLEGEEVLDLVNITQVKEGGFRDLFRVSVERQVLIYDYKTILITWIGVCWPPMGPTGSK